MNDLEAIGAITQILLRSFDEERKLKDISRILRRVYLTECEYAQALDMSCEYATRQLNRLQIYIHRLRFEDELRRIRNAEN